MIRYPPRQITPFAVTRLRQISFALCCGMPNHTIAESLGIAPGAINAYVTQILDESGMHDRVEFALQQNAVVREKLHAVRPYPPRRHVPYLPAHNYGCTNETRVRQVSLGICCGLTYAQIARVLGFTRAGVEKYVRQILRASGVHSRLEFALEHNAAIRES